VRVRRVHPFGMAPKEAILLQRWLAAQVVARGAAPKPLRVVAGVDCAPSPDGVLHAAVVLCMAPDWDVAEVATASAPPPMPYVPGLLSFRETPVVLEALRRLQGEPQVLLVDGQGIAHPRRLGFAAHVGLHVDVPVVGVAKSRLCGEHETPGAAPGAWAPLVHQDERVGAALRSKARCAPLYVSVGNRIGLLPAIRTVMATTTRYRLPEPTRHADRVSRALARASREPVTAGGGGRGRRPARPPRG
jgi:deoxyribonuclease V